MSADRRDVAPADAALDAEIRAALAVDPAPPFQAQVRARIAGTRPAPQFGRPWLYTGASALAAVVLAAAFLFAPPRRTPPRTPPHGPAPALTVHRSIGVAPLMPSPAAQRLPSLAARTASRLGRPPRAPAGSSAAREPEVLLAPDETRALRALIAGVREGRIDLPSAAQATTPDVMEPDPIRNLVIAPIVITPVEGVRQ